MTTYTQFFFSNAFGKWLCHSFGGGLFSLYTSVLEELLLWINSARISTFTNLLVSQQIYLPSRLSVFMLPSLFQFVCLGGFEPVSLGCRPCGISGLSWIITVLLSSLSPRTSRLSVSRSSLLGCGGSFLLDSLKFLGYLSNPGSSLRAVGRVFFASPWFTKRSRLSW